MFLDNHRYKSAVDANPQIDQSSYKLLSIYNSNFIHEHFTMGWFKKKKDKGESKDFGRFLPMPTYGRSNPAFANGGQSRGVDWTANLPSEVMYKIFGYVCPHSMDESYDSCEHSALEDCCMLCDMRDLANCVKVSKRWRKYSVPVL